MSSTEPTAPRGPLSHHERKDGLSRLRDVDIGMSDIATGVGAL